MKLTVNGKTVEVTASGNTPLLYVLRNDLGLVGSRFGCGSGQCGACFVMVDGKPMASCDLPVSFFENKTVTNERQGAESPARRAGGAVRLLHERDHRFCSFTFKYQSQPIRTASALRFGQEPLPLRLAQSGGARRDEGRS
jgi:aerobic-type carbon monoxide dehydrogenase small subunit (CoxS/CutS family)